MIDGNGGSATVPITVSVNNINDAPTFANTSYTASVDEEKASGTAVTFGTALSSSDQDGDTVTYSLVGEAVILIVSCLHML